MGFPGGAGGKESTCQPGFNPGQEDPPEEEVAPYSSILAWKIPWAEEPGGLQSMWPRRAGHSWVSTDKGTRKTASSAATGLCRAWSPRTAGFTADFTSTEACPTRTPNNNPVGKWTRRVVSAFMRSCYHRDASWTRPTASLTWFPACPLWMGGRGLGPK